MKVTQQRNVAKSHKEELQNYWPSKKKIEWYELKLNLLPHFTSCCLYKQKWTHICSQHETTRFDRDDSFIVCLSLYFLQILRDKNIISRDKSYEWKWTWGERSGAFSSGRHLHVKGVLGQWSSGSHKRKEYTRTKAQAWSFKEKQILYLVVAVYAVICMCKRSVRVMPWCNE
jgi:hypothetical protein